MTGNNRAQLLRIHRYIKLKTSLERPSFVLQKEKSVPHSRLQSGHSVHDRVVMHCNRASLPLRCFHLAFRHEQQATALVLRVVVERQLQGLLCFVSVEVDQFAVSLAPPHHDLVALTCEQTFQFGTQLLSD